MAHMSHLCRTLVATSELTFELPAASSAVSEEPIFLTNMELNPAH
jgi:hypothetical protein